jgi:hypothetical protein
MIILGKSEEVAMSLYNNDMEVVYNRWTNEHLLTILYNTRYFSLLGRMDGLKICSYRTIRTEHA